MQKIQAVPDRRTWHAYVQWFRLNISAWSSLKTSSPAEGERDGSWTTVAQKVSFWEKELSPSRESFHCSLGHLIAGWWERCQGVLQTWEREIRSDKGTGWQSCDFQNNGVCSPECHCVQNLSALQIKTTFILKKWINAFQTAIPACWVHLLRNSQTRRNLCHKS